MKSFVYILYVYIDKYPEIFNYRALMKDLCFHENNKNTYIIKEFEKIFGQYCDGGKFVYKLDTRDIFTNAFCFIVSFLSLSGIIITNIFPRIFIHKVNSIILLLSSIIFNFYNIFIAFREEGVNLSDSKIYKYGEEFNNQIKEGLDYAFNRAKYLKATSIIVLIIILIELLLVSLKEKKNKKGKLIMFEDL